MSSETVSWLHDGSVGTALLVPGLGGFSCEARNHAGQLVSRTYLSLVDLDEILGEVRKLKAEFDADLDVLEMEFYRTQAKR